MSKSYNISNIYQKTAQKNKQISLQKNRKDTINNLMKEGSISEKVKQKFDALHSKIFFGQYIDNNDYDVLTSIASFGEKEGKMKLDDKKLSILKFFDANNSGSYSKKEVQQVKEYLEYAQNKGFSLDDMFNQLQNVDLNKDGVIAKSEYPLLQIKLKKIIEADINNDNAKILLTDIKDNIEFNKNTNTQADLSLLGQSSERIKNILKGINNTKELEKVLTEQEKDKGFSPLMLKCGNSDIEAIKTIINSAKESKDLLRTVLTQKSKDGWNSIMIASKQNNTEILKTILGSIYEDKELLKEILEQIDFAGNSVFDIANDKNKKILADILKEFVPQKIEKPLKIVPVTSLLDEPKIIYLKDLPKYDRKINLENASIIGKNTKEAKEILDAINDAKILKKVLEEKDLYRRTPLIDAISENNVDLVKVITEKLKNYPELSKEILLQTDILNYNLLHSAANFNSTKISEIILECLKEDKDALRKITLGKTINDDLTPLMYSAARKNLGIIKAIINCIKEDKDLLKENLQTKNKFDNSINYYGDDTIKSYIKEIAKQNNIKLN